MTDPATDLKMVELHCHLDGVADPAMLTAIESAGAPLAVTSEELARAYPVRSNDDFIRWFGVAHGLEGSLDGFRPILAQHVERLVRQGVHYTELMVGSSEILDGDDPLGTMKDFRAWLTALEAGRIQVELIMAVSRTRSAEWLADVLDRTMPLFDEKLLVGLAVAGWPERGHPVAPLRDQLSRARDHGIGVEIHAGEWAGPESVWDALDNGRPDRLGHAVGAFADPRLLDAIGERGVHLEMCLTSNLKTGAIERFEDHPLARARDLGLSFSLHTDDPGAFECTMTSEHQLARDVFGFTTENLQEMAESALAARFQPDLRIPSR